MIVKQDNTALTALEAAMLGMWLMGMRNVRQAVGDEHMIVAHDDKYHRHAGLFNISEEVREGILAEGGEIWIFPWLESHGITPPEVEG